MAEDKNPGAMDGRRRRAARGLRIRPWIPLLAPGLALAGLASAAAQAAHNPGYDRPGLGFTPTVLDAGAVTWEQGLPDFSHDAGVSSYTADTLLRAGIGHALELQLGSGWGWTRGVVPAADGRPDTTLAVKFAPAVAGVVSWGFLGTVEFTDGARALRAPRRQYTLGFSANWQRDDDHSYGFYAEAARGAEASGLLAVNHGWALSPTVDAYVELAWQQVAGTGSGSLGGAGLAWQVTPRVQLDVGARHRLSGQADDWEGGAGVAVYFGN